MINVGGRNRAVNCPLAILEEMAGLAILDSGGLFAIRRRDFIRHDGANLDFPE